VYTGSDSCRLRFCCPAFIRILSSNFRKLYSYFFLLSVPDLIADFFSEQGASFLCDSTRTGDCSQSSRLGEVNPRRPESFLGVFEDELRNLSGLSTSCFADYNRHFRIHDRMHDFVLLFRDWQASSKSL
jgi:hypothetical protein